MSHSRLGMVLSPLLSTIFTVMLVHPPQWLAPPGAEQRQGTTLWKMEAASQEDTPPPSLHDRTIHNFPGTCPQGMGSSDTPAPQIVFEQMRQDLRTRIEAAGTPPQLTVGDTSLRVSGLLPQF